VSQSGHALICDAEEVNVLGGAGKGVMLMKLGKGDALVGARILRDHNDALVALNENGTEYRVSLRKYDAHARGGKGQPMFRRGRIDRAERPEITVPDLTTEG
jgi:DNA gyrase subunit A